MMETEKQMREQLSWKLVKIIIIMFGLVGRYGLIYGWNEAYRFREAF